MARYTPDTPISDFPGPGDRWDDDLPRNPFRPAVDEDMEYARYVDEQITDYWTDDEREDAQEDLG